MVMGNVYVYLKAVLFMVGFYYVVPFIRPVAIKIYSVLKLLTSKINSEYEL